MCKNVPTLEERNYEWIHNLRASDDEIDLIVNIENTAKWAEEGKYFTLPRIAMFLDKVEEDDLPGESAVLGTRKPGDRKSRRKATAKAKRHLANIYPLTDAVRKAGSNGYIKASGAGEVKVSTTDLCRLTEYKRADRRKSRHKGKLACDKYADERLQEVPASEVGVKETFIENPDGTIRLEEYLYPSVKASMGFPLTEEEKSLMKMPKAQEPVGEEYDEEEDDYAPEYMSREWCEMECIDYDDDEDDDFEEVESYEEYLQRKGEM